MKNMLKQMLGAAACCAICTTLPLLPASAAEVTLGDVNADSAIDATDASEILVYATEVGAGTAQAALNTALADVNEDGTVNALDASDVLVYTTKTGSGYTGTMEQHIRSKKNFEYYHTLSDYEVYAEYCEMYGFEAEEELPSEEELPDYQLLRYYTTETPMNYPRVEFYVWCTEDLSDCDYLLSEMPELFGFPEDWNIIELFSGESSRMIVDGVTYYKCSVLYNFDELSYYEPDYTDARFEDNVIDAYRVLLSLYHSDFVAEYGCPTETVEFYTIEG